MRKGGDGKFSSVVGTKGYRWLESANVREFDYLKHIDLSYFTELANKAIETINQFGPFDRFVEEEIPPFDIN